ncbi:acyltransferase domain-containing protein, partial [Mycobacterium tuberculosis]
MQTISGHRREEDGTRGSRFDAGQSFGDRVSIAVVNGPSAVVVSGEVGALEELIAVCSTKELRTRRIEVDYASHSVEVEAIRGPLAEALSGIEPRSTRTVFFSTVTGNRLDTAGLDADYWYRNAARPCYSTRRCATPAS